MSAVHMLPEEFADLEPFVDYWARGSQQERLRQRLAARMDAIQAFYDAITPRLQAVLEYLDTFPLDELPPQAERLMQLALSAAQVAPAVELFGQPAVACGFDAMAFLPTHEPVARRPKMSFAPEAFL